MVDAGLAHSESGIFTGAPVLIRALQNKSEYNGCKGIVSAAQDDGRYQITVTLEGGVSSTKVLALKPTNFQLDAEALRDYLLQKRAEHARRNPPLEDLALLWSKGKGLSSKSLATKTKLVPELEEGCILLRIDKFALSQMALGYLMKGFTRTFAAFHNFYKWPEEGYYRSACWGYATVVESSHPKVSVGTRLFGLVPPAKYQLQQVSGTVPPGKNGEPAIIELAMEDIPYNLRRFQELEVVEPPGADEALQEDERSWEDWRCITRELYTMAFYMDENLLVDTGMINCVVISCASAKTAIALAYCLRMREMRHVWALTCSEHADFVRSTELYHNVFTYDEVDSVPNNSTVVYMDFKCDGELRQRLSARMGTNLMYSMVIGPAVFQKKRQDQIFEKRSREILFDEATWRERRKLVAEVTKTGRNEQLRYSYKAFVDRLKKHITLKHLSSVDTLVSTYDRIYSNSVPPGEAYVCSFHEGEFEGEELWEA